MNNQSSNAMEKLLPYNVAHYILGEFIYYNHQFKAITKRAKIRFETRDWHGTQSDMRERQDLYKMTVGNATDKVVEMMGDRIFDRATWAYIKKMYSEDIENYSSKDIAETFYNSVFRHTHKSLGISADRELMFVVATNGYEFTSKRPIFNTYSGKLSPVEIITQILNDYHFDAPYQNLERDVEFVMAKVYTDVLTKYQPDKNTRVEILRAIFYRNKAAYVIGRTHIGGTIIPFVMPFLHDENGIYIDAFLVDSDNISSIFSYTRSYFLVDIEIPHELVNFLKTILPTKLGSELYKSIGFEKHGKTELYRDFVDFLQQTDEQFVLAPGIKGMVMTVFTLPSYHYVFKVIKDRFDPPKKVTHTIVKEKYELVNRHDRTGRMADTHEFEQFTFEKSRFSSELLDELQKVIPAQLRISGDKVIIPHLYVEKKMTPLNLYLQTATRAEAEAAINEYGKAIKDLAAVNIFPGDMLLKNFGVTRLKRVVFYDYDEICFVTDCNFRIIPEARDDYDEYSSGAWYSVNENDIFPEEFPNFLIGSKEIRAFFQRKHGDLFTVQFWKAMQKHQESGVILDVFPYPNRLRFKEIYKL